MLNMFLMGKINWEKRTWWKMRYLMKAPVKQETRTDGFSARYYPVFQQNWESRLWHFWRVNSLTEQEGSTRQMWSIHLSLFFPYYRSYFHIKKNESGKNNNQPSIHYGAHQNCALMWTVRKQKRPNSCFCDCSVNGATDGLLNLSPQSRW